MELGKIRFTVQTPKVKESRNPIKWLFVRIRELYVTLIGDWFSSPEYEGFFLSLAVIVLIIFFLILI